MLTLSEQTMWNLKTCSIPPTFKLADHTSKPPFQIPCSNASLRLAMERYHIIEPFVLPKDLLSLGFGVFFYIFLANTVWFVVHSPFTKNRGKSPCMLNTQLGIYYTLKY